MQRNIPLCGTAAAQQLAVRDSDPQLRTERTMMHVRRILVGLMIPTLLAGCATVPPEAVILSSEVGNGIRGQHAALVKSIDAHFSLKQAALDAEFVEAVDRYLDTITQAEAPLGIEPELIVDGSGRFAPDQFRSVLRNNLGDVADDIQAFLTAHSGSSQELERARLLLAQQANANYKALAQANATVTALLESAVDVEVAGSEAYAKLSRATEGRVDLEMVLDRIDELLMNSGDKADEVLKFYDEVKKLLEKSDNE